jgi:prepilin-type N-terminal cleavage/methylation domain-containing protein
MSHRRPAAGHRPPPGMTLVELLVVMAIIGLLLAILLPAVQAAREAGRRTACQSNLRQLALAALAHEQARGFLPTGGWGGEWTGDPDRGYDVKQPGGWAFNLLPHLEETALRDLGRGMADANAKAVQAAIRLSTPVPVFTCPTRRPSATWPLATGKILTVIAVPQTIQLRPPRVFRGDYAANMGSGVPPSNYRSGASFSPTSLADTMTDAFWAASFGPAPDGVIFRRSRIRLKDITDGTTSTYLFGEKYIDPAKLSTGRSDDDDQSLYSGHDRDSVRVACVPPYQDRPGFDPQQVHGGYPMPIAYGSGHPVSCGMARADGSVDGVAYTCDPAVHRAMASRNDSQRP